MNKKALKFTKAVAAVLVLVFVFSCVSMLTKTEKANAGLVGDVNEDGVVNSRDLSFLQKIILGLSPVQTPEATPEVTPTPPITEPPVTAEAPLYNPFFYTMEELESWVNEDESKYEYDRKNSLEWIKMMERDGGVIVPNIDGVSVLDIKEDIAISLRLGNYDLEGKGYFYRFKSEAAYGFFQIYLIAEEDEAAAAERPMRFQHGKPYDDERAEMLENNHAEYAAELDVNGEKCSGYYWPVGATYPEGEVAYFIYDEHFAITLVLFDRSKKDMNSVLEKLTFDLYPIEVKEGVYDYVEPTPAYTAEYFINMIEFEKWVNDPNKKMPEASKKVLESIKKDGGVYLPCINDTLVHDDNDDIRVFFGTEQAGQHTINHGYGYTFKAYDGTNVAVDVVFIDDENVVAAKSDPVRFLDGRYNAEMTEEEANRWSGAWQLFSLGDRPYNGFKRVFPGGGGYDLYFIYEDNHMVHMSWYKEAAGSTEFFKTMMRELSLRLEPVIVTPE